MPPKPPTAEDRDMLDRWAALLGRCAPADASTASATATATATGQAADDDQAAAGTDPEPYGLDLLKRWSEPQRRYHTTAHLRAMLDQVDLLAEHAEDADAVRLAVWYHDAVYQPERSENEERSARLALRALADAGVPDALAEETARLVRLTVTHHPEPGDRNGEVLCDADLAVLGGSPDAYAAYAAAVREEYSFVPPEAFREGRAAVLRQLLDLPALFRTPTAHARYDAPARANLAAELAELTR